MGERGEKSNRKQGIKEVRKGEKENRKERQRKN